MDPAPSKQTPGRCLLESSVVSVVPLLSVPELPPPVLRRSLDPLRSPNIPACSYLRPSEPAIAARHTKHQIQNPSTNIHSQHPPRFVRLAGRHSRVVAASSCADSALPSGTAGTPSCGSPAILRAAAEYKSDSSHSEPELLPAPESASVIRPGRPGSLHSGAKIGKTGVRDNFAVRLLRTVLPDRAPTPVDDQALEFF